MEIINNYLQKTSDYLASDSLVKRHFLSRLMTIILVPIGFILLISSLAKFVLHDVIYNPAVRILKHVKILNRDFREKISEDDYSNFQRSIILTSSIASTILLNPGAPSLNIWMQKEIGFLPEIAIADHAAPLVIFPPVVAQVPQHLIEPHIPQPPEELRHIDRVPSPSPTLNDFEII